MLVRSSSPARPYPARLGSGGDPYPLGTGQRDPALDTGLSNLQVGAETGACVGSRLAVLAVPTFSCPEGGGCHGVSFPGPQGSYSHPKETRSAWCFLKCCTAISTVNLFTKALPQDCRELLSSREQPGSSGINLGYVMTSPLSVNVCRRPGLSHCSCILLFPAHFS